MENKTDYASCLKNTVNIRVDQKYKIDVLGCFPTCLHVYEQRPLKI